MKKTLLAIVFAAFAFTANAQSEAGSMFIKPMAGGTLATLTNSDGLAKMKFGFVGGAEFGYQVSNEFALTAGVLASMQGAKMDGLLLDFGSWGTFGINKSTVTMTYLNVPVLANYYVAPGLAIKAGVQPGFLISQKLKVETSAGDVEDTSSDGYKKFDLSIPLGLSYEFDDFVIDARYNLGLTKVFKEGKSKNSVIMLTVGYKIPL